MLNKFVLVGLTLMHCLGAHGVVRTVVADDRTMAEIHLSMGKSTVLHFLEKPIKVITGNQNYFNIEFTGEDVTIQPLGAVVSNLFVYTEFYRYGFVLKVGGSAYDDLVQVRWRSHRTLIPLETPVMPEEKVQKTTGRIPSLVKLSKSFVDKTLGITVVELEITGVSNLKSKNIGITAQQTGKNLPIKNIVFDRDVTGSKNIPLKARVFLDLKSGKSFLLVVNILEKKFKVPVQGGLTR